MAVDLAAVMRELEALGTERTKKSYMSRGVEEPLFGVAYAPLHDEALETAEAIGTIEVTDNGTTKQLPSAAGPIRAAAEKGKVGFKRRAVRC